MMVFMAGYVSESVKSKSTFMTRSKELREFGHNSYNPCNTKHRLELELGRSVTDEEVAAVNRKAIDRSDAINLLPGWNNSKEAIEEFEYAKSQNKIIIKIKIFDWYKSKYFMR